MLNARKDNTLYENATGGVSNGAGPTFFVGNTNQLSGSLRRALVAFPVADSIPPGSTILSASLTLHMSRTNAAAPSATVELHRALADWGEGTSVGDANGGAGAAAATGDATWVHRFFGATSWSTPGGDFDGQSDASKSVGAVDFYTWESTGRMVSAVQQWLDNPASNFGWVILGDEEGTATAKRFDSRENIDPSVRPRLAVTYQPGATGVERENTTPTSSVLLQNYPNPFNPTTNIRWTIVDRRLTIVKVFDVLGREVATLLNEVKDPGTYTVQFDGARLPSGVYYYRLQSGAASQVKRMVLMK
jgi:hypothetical protein